MGFSYVVTRQNHNEISRCAQLCERAGSQYLELKPFAHPDTKQLLPLPAKVRQAIRAQIEKAHAHHLKVFVYTVNELQTMLKLKEMGVDGIFSDYPERIHKANKHGH